MAARSHQMTVHCTEMLKLLIIIDHMLRMDKTPATGAVLQWIRSMYPENLVPIWQGQKFKPGFQKILKKIYVFKPGQYIYQINQLGEYTLFYDIVEHMNAVKQKFITLAVR